MKLTTFNALKSRNYRLYFIGQSTSLIGTWMQKTAVSWVIYSLTHSKFMLGVSVFATLFPTALFSLLGGVVADRYNRYHVLLLTQILAMLQAVLLTLSIVLLKQDVVWVIIILSAVLGIINGFDAPARQALVRELIADKESLPNALALNSSMVNLSKLIGPTIAGFVLHQYGDQICFGINAASFIAVIGCLLLMRLPAQELVKKERNIKREFREAFANVKENKAVSTILFFTGMVGFFVLPFTTLTPVFAQDVFKGNASTLGYLDGFIGLGAFTGALYLASLKPQTDLSKVLAVNTFIFGIGLILFSLMNNLMAALAFLLIGAFGMMSVRTVSNTIIQLNVPGDLRGRVISLFLMTLTASIPLGSLMISTLSEHLGVQKTVFIEGVIAVLIALCYARYLKKEKIEKEALYRLKQQSAQGNFLALGV